MTSKDWILVLLAAALVCVSARLAFTINGDRAGSDADAADPSETVLDCIMTRASVRQYADSVVPDSVINQILRAGMAAPSAANKQPWHFVVIKGQALKDSITADFKYAKMVAGSAFDIVVCADLRRAFDGDTPLRGNWVLDCSAATENILLAAHALGVGAVWCGVYPEDDRVATLTRLLGLPAGMVPLNVISLGYPAAEVTPKDKWDPSKVSYAD